MRNFRTTPNIIFLVMPIISHSSTYPHWLEASSVSRATPSSHPFFHRIFPEINHSFWVHPLESSHGWIIFRPQEPVKMHELLATAEVVERREANVKKSGGFWGWHLDQMGISQ